MKKEAYRPPPFMFGLICGFIAGLLFVLSVSFALLVGDSFFSSVLITGLLVLIVGF
jgi:hypothetical protein